MRWSRPRFCGLTKATPFFIFAFLILLTAAGCHQKRERENHTLKINFQEGDLPSLHPHDLVIYLRGLSLAKTLFEPLTRINGEGKAELAGAETVSISDDQLHYTFTLRPNHWSDGTPVTAHHYATAWKAALKPSSTCSRAELLYVLANGEKVKKGVLPLDHLGVHVVNDLTLIVDLEYPCPTFLDLMAQAIAAPLVDPENHSEILFNGPFQVAEWKKGNSMRLLPNPHYWDHAHVLLEEISISFIEDTTTVYSLFEKGEVDWVGVPLCPLSAVLIQQLQKQELLRSHPIGRSFWIFLNNENSLLASPYIRYALSLSLNRQAITDHILLGGEASLKPLSNQLLPILHPFRIEENRERAHELFQYWLTSTGYTRETLPPLEISYSQQSPRKQLAEYLQETWKKELGIDIRLKSVEWNVLRSNLEKGLYTISMAYEGAFYKDPFELLERYTSLNPSNFCRWLNSDFALKIAQAKQESNCSKRTQLLSEAELILLEQMPVIPICSDRLLFAHSPTLSGYTIDSIGAIDFSRASLISINN